MSDEAILRIVVKEEGDGTTQPTAPQPSPAPTSSIPPPAKLSTGGISQAEYQQLIKQFGPQQAQVIASSQGGVSTPSSSAGVSRLTKPIDSAMDMSKLGTESSRASDLMIQGMTAAGIAAKTEAVAIQASNKAWTKTLDTMLDSAQQMRGTIGGIFGTMAGGALDIARAYQKSKTVAGIGDAASGALAGGPAGVAIAIFAVGVVAATKAIIGLTKEANTYAERFGQYNLQLSQALSQAEVRRTYGDLRRAQESGPALSHFVEIQSGLEQSWEDFKTRFLTAVLPFVEIVITGLETIITLLTPFVGFVEFIGNIFSFFVGAIRDILKYLSIISDPSQQAGDAFDPNNFIVPAI